MAGLTAGAWFGEGSMLKSELRRYDVVALRDTRLALMDRIVGNDFDGYLAEVQQKNAGRPKNQSRKLGRAADAGQRHRVAQCEAGNRMGDVSSAVQRVR